MNKRNVPAWAKVELTGTEREALARAVLCDGQPCYDSSYQARVLGSALQRLRKKGVIAWNTDGVYLTEFGRYIAMRNPATEPPP